MENFMGESLEIVLRNEGNKTFMAWKGQSDDRNPSILLDPYLDSLLDDLKGSELNIEFEKLEYMNSSTVQPIVQFLKKLNTNEIKTIVTYDANSKWQSASFKALNTFSKMFPHITVKSK